jgi:flavin reductase (DIM6/NTAB) family NADH-FMN oxidoreductase RutF
LTALRSLIRQQVRGLVRLPQYGPVALNDPQQEIEVTLETSSGSHDVTRNNVVAALRPFTIGVMTDANGVDANESARLRLHQRAGNRLLGSIDLRRSREIPLAEHRLQLFEPVACQNHSATPLGMRLFAARARRRAVESTRRNPHNFQMSEADLRANWALYICPRPVVLVTVEHNGSSNIFPMDLIGPTNSPWFTMALRLTSPAVRLMQESGRMALASIPYSIRETVYRLGKHHSLSTVDWSSVPLRMVPSSLFGLPVPDAAIRVREVRVKEFHQVGSHMLFITSIERETEMANDEPQMFHSFRRYSA